MSNPKAKKDKAPSKMAALPFFFFALVTFMSDLPIVVPAFLLAIGLIVWKNQRDAMARAKMPPLPPSSAEQAQGDDELSSSQFGRTLDPLPYDAKAPEESYSYYEAPPAVVVPPWEPSLAQIKNYEAGRTTSAAAAPKNRKQTQAAARTAHALVPNLRDAQNLRQAIVTMTVLGPPRAFVPFDADITRRRVP